MKKYLEIIILLVVIGSTALGQSLNEQTPYVILVSFDGFRHDYVEKYNAPNFKSFIKNGVAAKAMIPSFPSKTFPNHYTLVTGLYPDNHGLVDNTFYDSDLDLIYRISNRERVQNPAFYGGLPLWQLTQQNGMKSASFFWVGSEAPVQGQFPTYYKIYDDNLANEPRIEQVVNWLKLPAPERPNFISLYFSLVDNAGHAYGPDHEETKKAVLEADRLLGMLKKQTDALNLPINIIVVSDHGMEPIEPKKEKYIEAGKLLEGLNNEEVRMINNGPHAHFYVNDEQIRQQTYKRLKQHEGAYQVYYKQNLPPHMHYGTHSRIGDIVLVMKPGHYISSEGRIKHNIENKITRGEHGFDPKTTPTMGAIFYANGPNIKKGLVIEEFENVHVYPLIAELLGITKVPAIDGQLEVLKGIIER
ncbi:alkaline phosphatase family protein [Roseivirga thermotolerans]|uniref:Alkaline phosphatase family protein n=1 Tax=Roseivirga thermotolerans TaxID=1758176 RepID=A0ABQ3IAG8_9BACT|nr:ectonucleotide pyrophosphatase/phosphodiesterase [Roseivirga thermotolerans]GHE67959.1 alkaline phosphatase family protein [Roseivirga thermotolerans]